MRRFSTFIRVGCCSGLIVCGMLSSAAEARSFDLRPPARARLQAVQPIHEDAIRTTHLSAGTTQARGLTLGDRLAFQLWDDLSFTLVLKERLESPLGGESFLATVEGRGNWRLATVLETADGLQVEIQDFTRARVYRIVSTAAGVTVEEIDPTRGCDVPAVPRRPKLSEEETSVSVPSPAARLTASLQPASTLVDILMVYDAKAALWAQNNGGGLTNFAQQAVAKMNACLANNELDSLFRFRLVGVESISASATDVGVALDNAHDGVAGWERISAAREVVGADIVCTLIDTGSAHGVAGVGFSLTGTSTSRMRQFADWAYNALAVRSVAISQTATHEVGHNMGCGHTDLGADPSNRGPQSDDWSRGYYFEGTDHVAYYTVMAYNDDGYGNTYTSAPIFSSPNRSWMGTVVGDSLHDNERVLRTTYAGVANYRPQVVPMSYDVFFEPASRTLFETSLTVTLTPGKEGATIRYTLDGSLPTATTGLVYQGPFTITSTTTVRATTVTDGVAGPLYEAVYFKSDLGSALNAPQLNWTTNSTYPWVVETSDTFDGECALQSTDGGDYWNQPSWISAQVTGPTQMSFRYKISCYSNYAALTLAIDNQTAFETKAATNDEWRQAMVDIPAGTHTVKFSFACQGGRLSNSFNGAWLDTVQFDVLSQIPQAEPATTDNEATACTFSGSTNVVLTATTPGAPIFYTLDGSDPNGATALLYTEPIQLTRSTLIQAVETDPGRDSSPVQRWLYLERHPIQPGEWTTDVAGVRAAAATNGNLVCVLLANLATCGYCQMLDPIAQSVSFTQWAAANGIYLVSADASVYFDTNAADDWFWDLYRKAHPNGGSVSYPTMYFVKPTALDAPVAEGLARSGYTIGSQTYTGTLESLIDCFSSVLTSLGVTPTAFVPPAPAAILNTQDVVWSNASEQPWRESFPSQMKAGALMNGQTYSSVLTATVSGKGRFVFSYQFNSYSPSNTFTVQQGNSSFVSCAYNSRTGQISYAGTVTNEVTSTGTTTFTFTVTVGAANRDYSDAYVTECAAWLSNVQWIPETGELFPTLVDVASTFGASSALVSRVTDATSLAAFNAFLKSCGVTAVSELTAAQKGAMDASFALSPYVTPAVLFDQAPGLRFVSCRSTGANWEVAFTLETPKNVAFVSSRVRELLRVGTSLDAVSQAPEIVTSPSVTGKNATLTVAPPSPTRGFMKLSVP